MKVYPASAIHNVAVVGHNGVGKTTLVSALLHEAGATPRFGRVEDGNAPTDFDPEEIERKISISASRSRRSSGRSKKVNLIDTPGYGIFVSEMICGLKAADAALLVVDAVAGVEVQTEKAWKLCDELGLPPPHRRQPDGPRERRRRPRHGAAPAEVRPHVRLPSRLPIGREKSFRGVDRPGRP